jgi:hypothetical protein
MRKQRIYRGQKAYGESMEAGCLIRQTTILSRIMFVVVMTTEKLPCRNMYIWRQQRDEPRIYYAN